MARAEAKYRIVAIDKTAATLRAVERRFKATGDKIAGYGKRMTFGLTAPLAAFGATVIGAAGNFEAAMKRVEAKTGATGEVLKTLNDEAKRLGSTTQFSASEAAQGMELLAQAGFRSAQIIEAIPDVLNLAAAAQIGLGEAADISAGVLRGYRLEVDQASRVNDVLATGANAAKQTISDMGEAMSYSADVAADVGIEFEEASAALSLMANASYTGSRGGRALANSLVELSKPSSKAREELAKMGVQVTDSTGRLLPLVDILKAFEIANIDTTKAIELLGNVAGKGFGALLAQGSGALEELTSQMRTAGGTAERIGAVQMEGFNGAVKRLRSAFEGLQIALADTGLLDWFTNFTNRLAGWIQRFSEASESTRKMTVKIGLLAAAIGPAVFLIGKLIAALAFIATPIGAAIAAVGAFVLVWRNWGTEITESISSVIDWITAAFNSLGTWLARTAGNMVRPLISAWKNWSAAVLQVIEPVIEWIKGAFTSMRTFVNEHITQITGMARRLLEGLSILPGAVGQTATLALVALAEGSDRLYNEQMRLYEQMGVGLGAALQRFALAYQDSFDVDTSGLREKISAVTADVGEFVGTAAEGVKSWVAGLASQVEVFIANTTGAAREAWLRAKEFIESLGAEIDTGQTVGEPLQQYGQAFLSLGIPETLLMMKRGFEETGDAGEESMKKIRDAARQAGETLTDHMIDAVTQSKSALESLADFAEEVFDRIARALVSQNVVGPLLTFLGLPGRASGGTVTKGTPYIVGETGAELFVPGASGAIVSNRDLARLGMYGGGAPMQVTFTIHANDTRGFDELLAKRRNMIIGMINEAYNRRGIRGPVG